MLFLIYILLFTDKKKKKKLDPLLLCGRHELIISYLVIEHEVLLKKNAITIIRNLHEKKEPLNLSGYEVEKLQTTYLG